MDTSWSEKLERFMLDRKEQGKTPIACSATWITQISELQKKPISPLPTAMDKLNHSMVVRNLDSSLIYTSQSDDRRSDKQKTQRTIVIEDASDEEEVNRNPVFLRKSIPPQDEVVESIDAKDITDFGMPLTSNLDERLLALLAKIREQVTSKGHPLLVIAHEFSRIVCFSLILKAEFIDHILDGEL